MPGLCKRVRSTTIAALFKSGLTHLPFVPLIQCMTVVTVVICSSTGWIHNMGVNSFITGQVVQG